MTRLVDETALIISNKTVGPRLHVMVLKSPTIAATVEPGQFVHLKVAGHSEHILRRPFSVYSRDEKSGTIEILYQEVGSLTQEMPNLKDCMVQLIGPVGHGWSGPRLHGEGSCEHALLVGGGVGAAPLFLLAQELISAGCRTDIVLGAQTYEALVARTKYEELLGYEPFCATDDGSYGRAGFCTSLVQERLEQGCSLDGACYDYLAVCGPEPLMRIVANMGSQADVYTEVSMEKRMACGIGACLSCVVDTLDGKKRSCVDGPVFDAAKVMW